MIKQIAGRAGRRSSRFPNGEVTCYKGEDMHFLRSGKTLSFPPSLPFSLPSSVFFTQSSLFPSLPLGLGTATEQIARAGLFPTAEQLEDFSILLQTQVRPSPRSLAPSFPPSPPSLPPLPTSF